MAAQRSATPHATLINETTDTPDTENGPGSAISTPTPDNPPAQPGATGTGTTPGAPAAPATPLAQATPLGHNTTPNNGPGPQNQDDDTDDNTIGPQDSTCTPTGPQTWGPAAVQWDIDAQCTLTIHHGTTPNHEWTTTPWYPYRSQITKIHIDGNLTLHTTDESHSGTFAKMIALREVQIDDTLYLSQTAAASLFEGDSALTAFTGNGTFATGRATSMQRMFYGCSGLTTLDVTHFSLQKVRNMDYMFFGCSGLTELDLRGFDITGVRRMNRMLNGCISLRSLWLGPKICLIAAGEINSPVYPDGGWVELTAPGGPKPIQSMGRRTEVINKGKTVDHFVRNALVVTVDYNNGQANHVQTLNLDASSTGSQRITWGTRPAPAGKVFGGWDFTTSDPARVTLDGSTVRWTTGLRYNVGTASLTAKWRSLDAPALDLKVHADGTNNPDGGPGPWAEVRVTMPASAANGDGIRIESLNGTGRTSNCTPATGTNTCTLNLTINQLRDPSDYDATYRLRASVTATDRRDTDTLVTGPPADKQGILPYTTVNYLAGTGTGTPPATDRALTDTGSQTARITVAGPSPITRPAHSLFNTWRSRNGTTVRTGTTPVNTSLGTTDAQGRTTVDLTATWTPLDGPTGISASRDPSTNQVTISGTAKPRNSADTIRLCHPTAGGGTQCHNATTDPTDANGNTLPYNGTTEHPWKITLPTGTPEGNWSIDTTLTTKDTAYPAGNQQVDSPTTRGNIHIPAPYIYMNTLPLTGGDNRHTLFTLTTALAAVTLLTAAATQLRNRRRKARHHQTAQKTQTSEQ